MESLGCGCSSSRAAVICSMAMIYRCHQCSSFWATSTCSEHDMQRSNVAPVILGHHFTTDLYLLLIITRASHHICYSQGTCLRREGTSYNCFNSSSYPELPLSYP
jgi:hypothetical protein